MSIKIIAEFISPATVRTIAYIYDDDDALVNPTHATTPITVTITDPAGDDVADAEAMTQYDSTTGTYEHFLYTTSSYVKGWYEGRVTTMDGAGATIKRSIADYGFTLK